MDTVDDALCRTIENTLTDTYLDPINNRWLVSTTSAEVNNERSVTVLISIHGQNGMGFALVYAFFYITVPYAMALNDVSKHDCRFIRSKLKYTVKRQLKQRKNELTMLREQIHGD